LSVSPAKNHGCLIIGSRLFFEHALLKFLPSQKGYPVKLGCQISISQKGITKSQIQNQIIAPPGTVGKVILVKNESLALR
jgi:hypothetical protein